MTGRLLQLIGVLAVIGLVAGSFVALVVVGKRVHVTVAAEDEAPGRGPDPIALVRADVAQLATDVDALSEGVGLRLEALHDALEESGRTRDAALSAEIAALRARIEELRAELQARLARGEVPPATTVATAPAGDPLEPTLAAPPAPEAKAAPAQKSFLSFKLPARGFAFDARQRWAVVPALSRVGFDAKSTLHDFSGATQKIEGELVANLGRPEDGCAGKLTVDPASLDSGEPARDADMRALLGATPLAFEWTSFTDTTADAQRMQTSGTVHGKLTIHGTVREVSMPVRVSVDASKRAVIEGQMAIAMSDFGIEPPSKLGVISVEDRVQIWIALCVRSLGAAEEVPR